MSSLMRPIKPEALAAKCEQIENYELPRLLEEGASEPRMRPALWYLQWVSQPSNYPGGLGKFTSDLVAASGDKIGTPHILKCKAVDRYPLNDARRILGELGDGCYRDILGPNSELFQEAFLPGSKAKPPREWVDLFLDALTPSAVRSLCRKRAEEWLAQYFIDLCELPNVGFRPYCPNWLDKERGAPWYFANVAGALLDFIDARSEQLRAEIAETEITQLISKWIVKSRRTREAVMITGNSRLGKTWGVKLNAKTSPGSCRLVDTPEAPAISDLLREVAKTLGLYVKPGTSCSDLRERIDYVLRFSHLQLIFDEANFLFPAVFSRNTTPLRLNWVRRAVIDKDVPAVFVCTPQSYELAKKRFVKSTGYAMEQFDERVFPVHLPDELSEKDLLAIARIHLGNVDENYLGFVVDQIVATERNFTSDLKRIAFLANDHAIESTVGQSSTGGL